MYIDYSDREKALVREHFDEINERLAAEGLRTISLDDTEHVERYGLEDLAAERGAQQPPATKSAVPEQADLKQVTEDEFPDVDPAEEMDGELAAAV